MRRFFEWNPGLYYHPVFSILDRLLRVYVLELKMGEHDGTIPDNNIFATALHSG